MEDELRPHSIPYVAFDPITGKRYDMQCGVRFAVCTCPWNCGNILVSVESLNPVVTPFGEGTIEPVNGTLSEAGWRELFCAVSEHFGWSKTAS